MCVGVCVGGCSCTKTHLSALFPCKGTRDLLPSAWYNLNCFPASNHPWVHLLTTPADQADQVPPKRRRMLVSARFVCRCEAHDCICPACAQSLLNTEHSGLAQWLAPWPPLLAWLCSAICISSFNTNPCHSGSRGAGPRTWRMLPGKRGHLLPK